nr:unnamed protein product [Digitaria exilis]
MEMKTCLLHFVRCSARNNAKLGQLDEAATGIMMIRLSTEGLMMDFLFQLLCHGKPDAQNNDTQQTVVLPKGNVIPSSKALAFYRASTFAVDVVNVGANDAQVEPKVSTYTVGPFQSSNGEKAKLKVKVRLNIHGIVSIESATMLEEDEVEVPVSATNEAQKEATKMDTDDTPNDPASGTDVNMESKGATDTAEGAENGARTVV